MRTSIKYAVLSLTICLIACGCSLFKGNDAGVEKPDGLATIAILPAGIEINKFVMDKDYSNCQDVVCLASLIDGAAPYYINSGANDILFCDFKSKASSQSFSVEIYKTNFISDARTFFDNATSVNASPLDGIGKAARLDEGLIGTYRIEAYKKNYFVRITTSSKDETMKDEIVKFAKEVVSKFP
ncbi:MAG: hypothetical protein HZA77_07555 [Candidatus Schekmanbacteria bacterium]|nr:hypothetical protein [Candidatus Schekmanbacteria bacterium]